MIQEKLESLIFRRPSAEDAYQVFELLLRCDIAEYGDPDSDIEDLEHEWGQIDLQQDAWLAYSPGDELIGYAAVLPSGDDFRYDFYVDPNWESESLGRALLARCEKRGRDLAQERSSADEQKVLAYVAHVNQRDRAVLEGAGFEPGQYYFQMRIDLSLTLPEPDWPEGVTLRTFVVDQDERTVYELIQAAFARPDRTAPTFEQWHKFMVRPDFFDASMWFLAQAGEQLVGACLCFPYSSGGWVRQLSVAENYRRQGIGAALLHQAFGEFKRRGFDTVGLSVESKRPDAYKFYQGVGMTPARQYDEYIKVYLEAT